MHVWGHDKWASLYRGHCGGNPDAMVAVVREMLGLHPNPDIGYHFDDIGRPILKDPAIKPGVMSVVSMGQGIFGHEVFDRLKPGRKVSARVFEDVAGVGAGFFANINGLTGLVSGMMEVAMLEGYQEAVEIADMLVKVEPSNVMGVRKKIGIGEYMDQARIRLELQQHPRAKLTEQWVTVPATKERALAIDLSREAMFADITNDLLEAARRIGKAVGRLRADAIYDIVLGIVNNYTFKDVAYNTYQTSAGTPPAPNNYVNSIANPITDQLTMSELIDAQFATMKDPISYEPLDIDPTVVICHKSKRIRLANIINPDGVRINDGSASPYVATYSSQAYAAGVMPAPQVYASTRINKRITDTDGLNLSGASATGLTFWGQPTKAFGLNENWPLQTRQASPDNYQALDQGIVASFFSNERSEPYVIDPRYMLKCTNS